MKKILLTVVLGVAVGAMAQSQLKDNRPRRPLKDNQRRRPGAAPAQPGSVNPPTGSVKLGPRRARSPAAAASGARD
jgi:hypothetical protein